MLRVLKCFLSAKKKQAFKCSPSAWAPHHCCLLLYFDLTLLTQEKILELGKRRQDLLDKLKRYQAQLEAKQAETTKLKQKFKVGMKKVLRTIHKPRTSLAIHVSKNIAIH